MEQQTILQLSLDPVDPHCQDRSFIHGKKSTGGSAKALVTHQPSAGVRQKQKSKPLPFGVHGRSDLSFWSECSKSHPTSIPVRFV